DTKERTLGPGPRHARFWSVAVLMLMAAGCSTASAPAPALPAAAGPAVEVDRLERMLYAFAHDSMMGRQAGTEGHLRATRYLEERARAFGLEPAGENGTYLQQVPLVRRSMRSTVSDA